jgi:hypothetical protein
MWEKLLGLLNQEPYTEDPEYVAPSLAKRDARRLDLAKQESQVRAEELNNMPGQGTLIGFDYLKGLKDDEEDSNNTKRFINLHKLLRGDYKDGKTEETSGIPEKNIR